MLEETSTVFQVMAVRCMLAPCPTAVLSVARPTDDQWPTAPDGIDAISVRHLPPTVTRIDGATVEVLFSRVVCYAPSMPELPAFQGVDHG